MLAPTMRTLIWLGPALGSGSSRTSSLSTSPYPVNTAAFMLGATYCLRYSTSPVMFWFLISPAMRPASFSAPGMLVWVASVPIA